jgi:hypothetical protein
MPKTGEYAHTTGEYAADCMHWTIYMRAGLEFPPCPQCHQVVEYRKIAGASREPQIGHEHVHGIRHFVRERWSQHHNAPDHVRWWSR